MTEMQNESKKAVVTHNMDNSVFNTDDEHQEEVKIPFQAHISIISQIYPTENILTPTQVFAARYKNQDVILKKIMKDKIDKDGIEQAIQEQNFQCQFNHINIVKGIGKYETDDAFCIVMEVIDQADYFKIKLIENYKPIRKELKLKMYAFDILEGLKYLHHQNVVHLDLKLENLYCQTIEKDGVQFRRVKIGDFGISRKVDPVTKKVYLKHAIGTRDYMAPEIKSNSEISLSVDIWAFGVILYQMATGYVPTRVSGFMYEENQEIPFRKRDWKKIENGEKLQEFIIKILQFNPEQRPTVDDLINDSYLQG